MLWKQFGLVKGVAFNSWRRVGPVLPAIKVYNQREVDELILLDILAHKESCELDLASIFEFGEECFVPFTVGGGIENVEQVQLLLRAGADKVCINTANFSKPNLITQIAKKHGSQSVVASIDALLTTDRKNWVCCSHAGQTMTQHNVAAWAKELEDRGAGEIIITSIERDGTLEGYDLDLIYAVTSVVNIPVIASGGAGNYQHMIDAVKLAGASAVAAASMFHFTEQTPAEAKSAMESAGIPVRKAYRNY